VNFSFFIANRIAIKGKKTFSKTIVRLATIGIAISVSVMLASIGILNGFKKEILAKVTGFGSHVQVRALDLNNSYESSPIIFSDSLKADISKIKNVKNIQKYIYKPAILKTDSQVEGIVLKGIQKDYDFDFLKQNLKAGNIPKLVDSVNSKDILMSTYQAKKLDLKVGDKVNFYFIQEPIRARQFIICGLYETGMEDFDHTFALVDLRHLQKLNNWDTNLVQGVEINLKNIQAMDSATLQINEELPIQLKAFSAKEIRPQIFDWLALLDTNVLIIMILMVLVGIINMITALLILILERTNMIGILKSLGSNNAKVQWIFIIQAAYIIGKGLLIGNIIFLSFYFLQIETHLIKLDAALYYLNEVPIAISAAEILMVNFGTFLICSIVMLVPSFIISGISPVKAIKFD